MQHTCREQTTQTRYKLLSLPVGVLVPVPLARAAVNSLLAADEGVAGRDNTLALLEAAVCEASLELGRWTCSRVLSSERLYVTCGGELTRSTSKFQIPT